MPSGPSAPFDPNDDLLGWMQSNLAQYGDVYRASIHGSLVYVINSPELAEQVLLKRWQNYLRKGQTVNRIAMSLGNGLISSNGKPWATHRRMMQPAFTREAVNALFDVFERPNIALREKWKQAAQHGETINVTRDVSETVLEVTLRSIFGQDYERIAADFALIADPSRDLGFAKTCSTLTSMIRRIVEERRSIGNGSRDILGMMMQARDRESGLPMRDMELAREALTLVIAGHETTASVLNWMWYLLCRHADMQERVAAEILQVPAEQDSLPEALARLDYGTKVIEEALRSYPPLWLMTRKAVKEDRLGEHYVPAGTEIYISPFLLQRNPHLWPRPDQFDPDRFNGEEPHGGHRLSMCPFGAGPRNCIGEIFARVEMQIHLITIARELRLRHDHTGHAEYVAGVNLLSKHDFIMRPEPRDPVSARA